MRNRLAIAFQNPTWMPVASILLLALLIRSLGLGAESAWIDEGYSLALARYPIPEIIRGTAVDQHPPLYYLLLHFWLWLGDGIYNARLLSVLLGLLNVYQVIIFGRRLGGQLLGLGAGLLLTINPMHVWYSQEARQYMLLAILTTAATFEFWACLQGKQRWFTYGLFVLLSLYTQYFTVFILLSHAFLTVVWTVWGRNKRIFLHWLFVIVGVGLFFLPWLPVALNQFFYHPTPWIDDPAAGDIRDILLRLLFGSGVLILPAWLLWLGLAGVVCSFIWAFWKLFTERVQSLEPVVFLAAWALLPYLAISMVSVFYPIFQFKQFLILLSPILMLAMITMGLFTHRWKNPVYFCLLLIPIFSLVYQQVTLSKDDWRGMSAYIQANLQAGDAIYVNPAGATLVLNLYLDPATPIKGYPPDYEILTGGWKGEPLTADIAAQQLGSMAIQLKRIWFVEFFPEFWDPAGHLPAWLDEHATMLDHQRSGNIQLRLYLLEKP